MIPGMNPKKMKQMMKQLGMKMDNIEDVEKVVVHTPAGNYIFDNAEVVVTTMQGTTTYQVNGNPRFEAAETEIPEDDVKLVIEQTSVSEEEARAALKEADGDIAEAIMKLAN
ncbi:MAG: nascent polypeptide-associated complex protein [Euryarchaeota archaeon]|nr:nascent polypeptide-associated complex protein [Euryarchaeota archaeon]